MKKRMLITTIVMVLVVAIALTTSSLAWFTMSAEVTISDVSFGAVAYEGADLTVSDLSRVSFGAGATIGPAAVQFDPVQGNPIASTLIVSDGTGPWNAISFADGTFWGATDVTTTQAGREAANQKVKLSDVSDQGLNSFFLGGFNVRNNGTEDATVTFGSKLNVGTRVLNNGPDGIALTADDFYEYTPAAEDQALAGALRVAIYTRVWKYNVQEEEYILEDGEAVAYPLVLQKIAAFKNYNVAWESSAWSVTTGVGAGENNTLYVTTPNPEATTPTYSRNASLADVTGWVGTGTYAAGTGGERVGVASNYTVESVVDADNEFNPIALDANVVIPEIAVVAEDTIISGLEFIVVAWLDGWDDECVPAAGGGTVSLTFTINA